MKLLLTLFGCVCVSASLPARAQVLPNLPSKPPLPPEAQALESKFQAEVAAQADKPYQEALAQLNKKYLDSLERARQPAQQKGMLDEALAISSEAENITKGATVPVKDDDKTPATLKNLRSTYRKAVARVETDRAQRMRPLVEAVISGLNKAVLEFTKEGKLEEAKTVRTRIDELQATHGGSPGERSLQQYLTGTKWLWNGSRANEMTFLPDGTVALDDWTAKGLVTGWKVVNKLEVILTILKGRENNLTATLIFAEDRKSFTGTDFVGKKAIAKSSRVQ